MKNSLCFLKALFFSYLDPFLIKNFTRNVNVNGNILKITLKFSHIS